MIYTIEQHLAYRAKHPTKTCNTCHRELPRSPEFFNEGAKRCFDGLNGTCRECRMASRRNPKPILESEIKKTCLGCGVEYSRTKTYFRQSKRYADGFTNHCKSCDTQRVAERAEGKTRMKDTRIGPDGMKACSGCDIRKPATPEFFNRVSAYATGLNTMCKACVSERYYKNTDWNNIQDASKLKVCSTCKEEKPATEEYYRARSVDRKLLAQCRACEESVAKQRDKAPAEDPERRVQCRQCGEAHARTLEWWPKSARCKDGMAFTCRACGRIASNEIYRLNKAGLRQPGQRKNSVLPTDFEIIKEARIDRPVAPEIEERRVLERARSAARGSNRRAQKMGDEERLEPVDLIAVYHECEGRCTYCHHRVYGRSYYDHIIPVVRGGRNHISNITLACRTCNNSKNAKLLEDWDGPVTFATD